VKRQRAPSGEADRPGRGRRPSGTPAGSGVGAGAQRAGYRSGMDAAGQASASERAWTRASGPQRSPAAWMPRTTRATAERAWMRAQRSGRRGKRRRSPSGGTAVSVRGGGGLRPGRKRSPSGDGHHVAFSSTTDVVAGSGVRLFTCADPRHQRFSFLPSGPSDGSLLSPGPAFYSSI